ncbi:MAG: hypothetical protein V3W19_00610 [Desulfatiglandales bacterium]
MGGSILIISDKNRDLEFFVEILGPQGFDVAGSTKGPQGTTSPFL